MTELELLKVIGYAQDVHILDAEEPIKKRKVISFPKPLIRTIAAILAVVLMVGLFLQTPVGAAAAEAVKEQFERFIDLLFPPKDMVMYVEGEPETVHVEAQGREPEANAPGFSIYVDTETYTMTEENGSWFIRPIPVPLPSREEVRSQQAAILEDMTPEEQEDAIDKRLQELEDFYASLPPIEMEIREIPDKTPEEAAEMVHSEMAGKWDHLSDIWGYGQPETLCIDVSQKYAANAPWEKHNFKSNGKDGCFQIILRGYREAAEGHGARFHQMMDTFTLVAPQDTSAYKDKHDALVEAMRQEIAFAQERDAMAEQGVLEAGTQTEMNLAAYDRGDLWRSVHDKMWVALEQTLDEEAMKNLTAEHWAWSTQKRLAFDQIREEMGGGTLTGTILGGESVKWFRERVQILLTYLEGTASPPERAAGLELSPNTLVEDFAAAYFRGDARTLQLYLSETYTWDVEIFSSGTEVVHAVKGMDEIPQTMAFTGQVDVSVEFRPTEDSDYFQYLSIALVWENDRWAVAYYGLEG